METTKIKVTVEMVTPTIAKMWLQMMPTNRSENQYNFEAIKSAMNRDKFVQTGESIKFNIDNELIDGQHRLRGIVTTNKAQELVIVRGLSREAFKYIDTGKTRTASDVLSIEGIEYSSRIAAMAKFIINFKSGRFFVAASQNYKKTRINNSDISAFVSNNLEKLRESMEYGYNKHNKVISSSILSAMHFILEEKNSEAADDFCYKIAKGHDLADTSPIFQLRQRLISDQRHKYKIRSLEKLALLCKAWNLYRSGKRVKNLTWQSTEPFPKPI